MLIYGPGPLVAFLAQSHFAVFFRMVLFSYLLCRAATIGLFSYVFLFGFSALVFFLFPVFFFLSFFLISLDFLKYSAFVKCLVFFNMFRLKVFRFLKNRFKKKSVFEEWLVFFKKNVQISKNYIIKMFGFWVSKV
jgi:hypothetical protein